MCDLDQWSNQIAAPNTTCLLSGRGRVYSVSDDTRQKYEEKIIGTGFAVKSNAGSSNRN